MIFVFRQRTLENTEGKSKKAIQRKWQHRVQKTKKNKTKTQHNMYWTLLWANKHKSHGTQNVEIHNRTTQKHRKTKQYTKYRTKIKNQKIKRGKYRLKLKQLPRNIIHSHLFFSNNGYLYKLRSLSLSTYSRPKDCNWRRRPSNVDSWYDILELVFL
jgi:hypothetical protein